MKQSYQTLSGWLAAVGFLSVASSSLAFGPQVERSLELNGITDIPGHKRAFFVLVQPDVWAAPRSFTLAEGEFQYGIKLLAVDTASNRVKIEKNGVQQSLRIHSTVNLFPGNISTADGNLTLISAPGVDGLIASTGLNNAKNVANNQLAGNPGYGSLPANNLATPVPGKNPPPGPASASGSSPTPASVAFTNPNAPNPAKALQDQSQAEWYQESANIERNRKETAQAVLAGEMDPWPRTPLTPSGISDKLIGTEAFFSDHIPGYRQPLSF